MKLFLSFLIMLSVVDMQAYNAYYVTELKKNIASGSIINISGCDFRGAGVLLKGLNLSNAQAGNVNFDMCSKVTGIPFLIEILNQKTDLTNVNFSNSILTSASFKKAVLQGANFSGANISFANFAGADLTGAVFTGTVGIETAFFCGATMPDGSKCSGASWKNKTGQTFLCQCPSKK